MIGIDNKSYDELIFHFYKIKEDLNSTFDRLDTLVSSLKDCYKTESGRELIDKYNDLSNANYQTVLKNFDSYIQDLKTARENIKAFDTKLSMQILEDIPPER